MTVTNPPSTAAAAIANMKAAAAAVANMNDVEFLRAFKPFIVRHFQCAATDEDIQANKSEWLRTCTAQSQTAFIKHVHESVCPITPESVKANYYEAFTNALKNDDEALLRLYFSAAPQGVGVDAREDDYACVCQAIKSCKANVLQQFFTEWGLGDEDVRASNCVLLTTALCLYTRNAKEAQMRTKMIKFLMDKLDRTFVLQNFSLLLTAAMQASPRYTGVDIDVQATTSASMESIKYICDHFGISADTVNVDAQLLVDPFVTACGRSLHVSNFLARFLYEHFHMPKADTVPVGHYNAALSVACERGNAQLVHFLMIDEQGPKLGLSELLHNNCAVVQAAFKLPCCSEYRYTTLKFSVAFREILSYFAQVGFSRMHLHCPNNHITVFWRDWYELTLLHHLFGIGAVDALHIHFVWLNGDNDEIVASSMAVEPYCREAWVRTTFLKMFLKTRSVLAVSGEESWYCGTKILAITRDYLPHRHEFLSKVNLSLLVRLPPFLVEFVIKHYDFSGRDFKPENVSLNFHNFHKWSAQDNLRIVELFHKHLGILPSAYDADCQKFIQKHASKNEYVNKLIHPYTWWCPAARSMVYFFIILFVLSVFALIASVIIVLEYEPHIGIFVLLSSLVCLIYSFVAAIVAYEKD